VEFGGVELLFRRPLLTVSGLLAGFRALFRPRMLGSAPVSRSHVVVLSCVVLLWLWLG